MRTFTDCRVQSWNQTTEIIKVVFKDAKDLTGGVCYGSCVEWLKRIKSNPTETTANRLSYLVSQAKLIGGRQRLYESARADVKARENDFTAAVHFQVMNRLVQIGKFGMSIEFLDGGAPFSALAEAFPEMAGGNVDYSMINISITDGGHAICAKIGDPYRLFDPNFGEFLIPSAKLDDFFSDYVLASALAGSVYAFVNVAKVTFD
jgi:hypothetical protein